MPLAYFKRRYGGARCRFARVKAKKLIRHCCQTYCTKSIAKLSEAVLGSLGNLPPHINGSSHSEKTVCGENNNLRIVFSFVMEVILPIFDSGN